MAEPIVVTTDRIQTRLIDPDALKTIRRLRRYGHEAYLVGGCVRDLLLGLEPKDFDVITSARPRQVRRLFSNSRVIGRRFRLVHVIYGQNIIEVSTFRADPSQFAEGAAPAAEEGEAPPADDARATDPDEEGVPLERVEAAVDRTHDPIDPDDAGTLAGARDAVPVDEPLGRVEDDDADDDDLLDEDIRDDDGFAPRRGRGGQPDDLELNNMFGDPEQDARRRDFTINALFYDPDEGKLIDWTGGLVDLEKKLVRSIRDPEQAFVEDPVRMIRAARFAAKLGFEIEAQARTAIADHHGILEECSQRRLLEEVLKILKGGYASRCVEVLLETGMLRPFLPDVWRWLEEAPPVAAPPASTPAAAADPVTSGAIPQGQEEAGAAGPLLPGPRTIGREAAVSTEVAALRQAHAPPSEAPAEEPEGEADEAEEPEGEADEAEEPEAAAPPADPRAAWGEPRELRPSGARLFPGDRWRPDDRTIEAFLRVTWERPPVEGANDWVEDPAVYIEDAIFEAAAFARDVELERRRHPDLAGLTSELLRAEAVLKLLRWNDRLDAVSATFTPPEPSRSSRRRRRRRGGGREEQRGRNGGGDRPRPDDGPKTDLVPLAAVERRRLLLGYLEGLDKLTAKGVPLTPAVQLSVLFAPLVLCRVDEQLARGRGGRGPGSIEELCDQLLFPIAKHHSLARRDRDRIKRIALSLRRLLSGDLRRKLRAGGRVNKLLARDYFREAIVLLWLHCRTTKAGWEEFRYWEERARG